MNKGTQFEYRVAKYYIKRGWQVIRSAGSHGVGDLIAFRRGEKDHIIQCKNNRKLRQNRKEKIALIQYCELHDKVPIWAWNHYSPNRKIGKTMILDLREYAYLESSINTSHIP